jgi:sodium transport system permease protein
VPGLAQNTLMMLVLKGESLTIAQVMPGIVVNAALLVGCLVFVARSMRLAVAR